MTIFSVFIDVSIKISKIWSTREDFLLFVHNGIFVSLYIHGGRKIGFISMEEDLELERQLKIFNRPPIRSFKVTQLDPFELSVQS